MKNKNSRRKDTLQPLTNNMKSANSIVCACGGNYVKKNKSRHMKTKLHQAYEQKVECINCGERATMEDGECPLCHMYQDLHRCALCDAMVREGEECECKEQNVCGNHGCGTELDEDEMIVYSLSRRGVKTRWCEECFDNDGADARRDGWVFDQDGEDILNEREEQGL